MLLFSAALAGTGREAQASCGDYVSLGDMHGHMSESERPEDAPRLPACHGPNCRKRVPLPLAPKPKVTAEPREWSYAFVVGPSEAGRQSALCDGNTLLIPQAVILPPVPPPRSAA
jgi:hypothetical protein